MSKQNPQALGSAPIGRLLLEYSIPAIIGMTITSLYHIVDSIFIGHGVGAIAISGLAINFPLMNLVIAFCTLVGTGGATISSIRLGQQDNEKATLVLGNVLTLSLILAFLFGSIALFFLDPILIFFGASAETLPYARDFMQIILLGNPIAYVMISLNNVMRATGYPRKAMLSSLLTVGVNIVLAPIFIFYFDWGMRGAGLATVLSQFTGMIWVLSHFLNKKSFIHFQENTFKLRSDIVNSIFSIGFAPFLMNICTSLVVILINNRLSKYGGDMAIGGYGIINRVLTLFVMTIMGLTMGMQPIAGYNYGAKKTDRVTRVLKYTIIAGFTITSIGFMLGQIFPESIASLFTDHPELIDISRTGLRISMLAFPLVGIQIVISNFFLAIGKANLSIILSLSRQMIFLIPALFLFSHYQGVKGVWESMAFSDLLAFILAISILILQTRKFNKENVLNPRS